MIHSQACPRALWTWVCAAALAVSGTMVVGSFCLLAADKDKPADSPLPPKKTKALSAIRKELPPKSEYFAFTAADLDASLNMELRKLGRAAMAPASDETFV